MRYTVIFPALLIAVVSSGTAVAAPPPQSVPQLSFDQQADLRCAAAFAIVATEQSGGAARADWPPLALRGKQFFADTGERIVTQVGLTREAVREVIAADVRALQTAPDPEAALQALAQPCVARLDASVPPLAVPDLKQCAAIMGLAYDELHAREGMSPAAQDLGTLASVLAAREREALVAAGNTSDSADRILTGAREAMVAEADDAKGGIDKYDIARCYEFARPTEKSHY